MVGFKTSSEHLAEISQILGLTEEQSKTYVALLSLGMATLGQISILSGLDYITTQETLQMLVGSKLALRIPGKVGRYIALEPYLKSFSLAYDPITLINIRKESSNTIKDKREEISEVFSKSTKNFQEDGLALLHNFYQSTKPMKDKFNTFSNEIKTIINSFENGVHENIILLQTSVDEISQQVIELNNRILALNLKNVNIIPTIYTSSLPNLKKDLDTLLQDIISPMSHFQNHYDTEFNISKESITKSYSNLKEELDQILDQFELNRNKDQQAYEEKVSEISLKLENAQKNAANRKGSFIEVRNNYEEINHSLSSIFTELEELLDSNEPILKEIIEDIQGRKLFKGKDIFLENLQRILKNNEEIFSLITRKNVVMEKIEDSNAAFKLSEEEIINTAETEAKNIASLLTEQLPSLKNDLREINFNVSSEFRALIHKKHDMYKREAIMLLEELNGNFSSLVKQFQQKIEETNHNYHNSVSTFTKDAVTIFEGSLKSFFEKEKEKSFESSGFYEIVSKTSEINQKVTYEIKELFNKVQELENSANSYFEGLNAFSDSFRESQLNTFILALKEVNEELNQQIDAIETQIDQEVSALTFSVKQMRQKLEKIFTISRDLDIPETEGTLFSSDLVVGEPSIIMMLRDLTLRSKSSLTILMPRPELQTLNAASKLPMRTRVTIIGDFGKVPETTLKRILQAGNLRLKQLDGIDFWGCIRDAEELLVCPEPKDPLKEALLGVITTNQNLVDLFSQELMTYTTRSREIII